MGDTSAEATPGIWVRLLIEGDTELTGFVADMESPHDFWSALKTPFIDLERAVESPPAGKKIGHDLVQVNRDRILLASVLPSEP